MTLRQVLLPILALVAPAAVHAFSVNPMSVEIDPDQPNAQKLFVLSNTSEKDVPVEVRVARPSVDERGVETLEMGVGEDLFVILPQQLILPAGGRRSVKVAYVGDSVDGEQTYRILFRQLPVNLPQSSEQPDPERPTFNMQVVLEYHTRVWITPRGLKEQLAVRRFMKTNAVVAPSIQSPDGTQVTAGEPKMQPVLEVVIANTGSKHGYILAPKLTALTSDGQQIVLPETVLKPLLGQVVLPGRERVFQLPVAETLDSATDIKELRLTLGKP